MTLRAVTARERRAKSEQTILEAATALMEEGAEFTELSIEQITSRAGISRTAFYGHFCDKGALIIRLLETIVVPAFIRADEELDGLLSGPDYADTALRAVTAVLIPKSHTIRAAIQLSGSDQDVAIAYERLVGKISGVMAAQIRTQQDIGVALPADTESLANVLVTLALDMIGLHLYQTDQRRNALIEALSLVWRRSIYGSR